MSDPKIEATEKVADMSEKLYKLVTIIINTYGSDEVEKRATTGLLVKTLLDLLWRLSPNFTFWVVDNWMEEYGL